MGVTRRCRLIDPDTNRCIELFPGDTIMLDRWQPGLSEPRDQWPTPEIEVCVKYRGYAIRVSLADFARIFTLVDDEL